MTSSRSNSKTVNAHKTHNDHKTLYTHNAHMTHANSHIGLKFFPTLSEEEFQDLGFKEYFNKWPPSCPLLEWIQLSPLSEDQAKGHFSLMRKIQEFFVPQQKQILLENLLTLSQDIPSLQGWNWSLTDLSKCCWLDLVQLAQFLKNLHSLHLLESKHPALLQLLPESCVHFPESLLNSLKEILNDDLNSLSATQENLELILLLDQMNGQKKNLIEELELKIQQELKIDVIHPFPRDVPINSDHIQLIINSPLLSVQSHSQFYTVSLKVNSDILNLENRIQEIKNHLEAINNSIVSSFFSKHRNELTFLRTIYLERQRLIFIYTLVQLCLTQKWTIPQLLPLENEIGFTLTNGFFLPLSDHLLNYHSISLQLDTDKSYALMGPPFSGKTTLLKSLFFFLSLVRWGLPVPAKEIKLKFPSGLGLLLKTSGSVSEGYSSFSKECSFLSDSLTQSESWILVDELFHSTDPQSGKELISLVVQESIKQKNHLIFTSHLSELIDEPNIHTYLLSHFNISNAQSLLSTGKKIRFNSPYEFFLKYKWPKELKEKVKKLIS